MQPVENPELQAWSSPCGVENKNQAASPDPQPSSVPVRIAWPTCSVCGGVVPRTLVLWATPQALGEPPWRVCPSAAGSRGVLVTGWGERVQGLLPGLSFLTFVRQPVTSHQTLLDPE